MRVRQHLDAGTAFDNLLLLIVADNELLERVPPNWRFLNRSWSPLLDLLVLELVGMKLVKIVGKQGGPGREWLLLGWWLQMHLNLLLMGR